jgi:hypothetical protein
VRTSDVERTEEPWGQGKTGEAELDEGGWREKVGSQSARAAAPGTPGEKQEVGKNTKKKDCKSFVFANEQNSRELCVFLHGFRENNVGFWSVAPRRSNWYYLLYKSTTCTEGE